MIPAALANHLWQSTLFIGVAWLLTLPLKSNRAGIRHGIWLMASLKFFIPFSLLISLGSHLAWMRPPAITRPELFVMENIGQPFAEPEISAFTPNASPVPLSSGSSIKLRLVAAGWFIGFVAVIFYGVVRWYSLAGLLGKARPLHEGREIEALRRLQSRHGTVEHVTMASSISAIEPGVRGIVHPVLLLPAGIAERLNDEQLEAILAHELSHIRRRDNLTAAIHMAVETIFWFHPLVWWIGSRLVDERERACDEEVLLLGSNPETYAGAILTVCEFYLSSPLTWVSGVTGSNLKKRIEAIMINRTVFKLNLARKALLVIGGVTFIGIPILFGSIRAPHAYPQSLPAGTPLRFEAASIKPSSGDSRLRGGRCNGIDSNFAGSVMPTAPPPLGTCRYLKATLNTLMNVAFVGFQTDKMVDGGPDWTSSMEFDVVAKAENPSATTTDQLRKMMQTLLAERFKVQFHREPKHVNGYALIPAKNGPKLAEPSTIDHPFISTDRPDRKIPISDLSNLTKVISGILKAPVIDRTGITGSHDFSLSFSEGTQRFVDPLVDPSGTSIFSAVQEQLGLRLESQKVSIEVIVIDRAEKPTENEIAGDFRQRNVLEPRAASVQQPANAKGVLSLISAKPEQAQPPSAASLVFEVASIKPNTSVRRFFSLDCHGTDSHASQRATPLGKCVILAATVQVIAFAYDLSNRDAAYFKVAKPLD